MIIFTETNGAGARNDHETALAKGSGIESYLSVGDHLSPGDAKALNKTFANTLPKVGPAYASKAKGGCDNIAARDLRCIAGLIYSLQNVADGGFDADPKRV